MSHVFKCANGENVTIDIDDFTWEAKVTGPDGESIGRIEFQQIEEENGEYLKILWMYLDRSDPRWKKQGIGREVLRLVKHASDLPIVAGSDTGEEGDGSHLTGDAPAFVAKMRDEGIIEKEPE